MNKEYAKYNVVNHICEKCGAEHASKRFFTKKILCNECAHKAFLKFLAKLPIAIIALYILSQLI